MIQALSKLEIGFSKRLCCRTRSSRSRTYVMITNLLQLKVGFEPGFDCVERYSRELAPVRVTGNSSQPHCVLCSAGDNTCNSLLHDRSTRILCILGFTVVNLVIGTQLVAMFHSSFYFPEKKNANARISLDPDRMPILWKSGCLRAAPNPGGRTRIFYFILFYFVVSNKI
uniref:Uncharacterized protein n=1 Tax=Physcomitrium patens TaxID=3218 RepID=A0A2K1J995_PHYPA|nr:hypothetical protein PHYPA_021207 [Physcomitrium patens]